VNIRKVLKKRKSDIVLLLFWVAVVSLVVITIYWVGYTTSIQLSTQKTLFPDYNAPGPGLVDLVIVLFAGVPIGFSLSDVGEIVYGYFAAMLLVFVISVSYVTLYIWYNLGWGKVFSLGAYDWEYAVFFAMEWVLRIMLPWILALCLLGLIVGAFLRELLWWD
jgi:hypothetical protein